MDWLAPFACWTRSDQDIDGGWRVALRRVVRAHDQGAVAPINRAVEPGRNSGREPRPTDTHTTGGFWAALFYTVFR